MSVEKFYELVEYGDGLMGLIAHIFGNAKPR